VRIAGNSCRRSKRKLPGYQEDVYLAISRTESTKKEATYGNSRVTKMLSLKKRTIVLGFLSGSA
jgi:hypothetical protein